MVIKRAASATSAVTLMTSWRPNVWRPNGSGRGNTSAGRDVFAMAPAFGCRVGRWVM